MQFLAEEALKLLIDRSRWEYNKESAKMCFILYALSRSTYYCWHCQSSKHPQRKQKDVISHVLLDSILSQSDCNMAIRSDLIKPVKMRLVFKAENFLRVLVVSMLFQWRPFSFGLFVPIFFLCPFLAQNKINQ